VALEQRKETGAAARLGRVMRLNPAGSAPLAAPPSPASDKAMGEAADRGRRALRDRPAHLVACRLLAASLVRLGRPRRGAGGGARTARCSARERCLGAPRQAGLPEWRRGVRTSCRRASSAGSTRRVPVLPAAFGQTSSNDCRTFPPPSGLEGAVQCLLPVIGSAPDAVPTEEEQPMSDLMMAEQLRFEAAPARRSHVRDTVFAVILFFAALACAATALAPGQG
jgi:hypothetical protein